MERNSQDQNMKLSSQQQAQQWNAHLGKHEYRQRKMPWGKYVNKKIEDLPLDYLKWAVINFEAGELRDYLTRELRRRNIVK